MIYKVFWWISISFFLLIASFSLYVSGEAPEGEKLIVSQASVSEGREGQRVVIGDITSDADLQVAIQTSAQTGCLLYLDVCKVPTTPVAQTGALSLLGQLSTMLYSFSQMTIHSPMAVASETQETSMKELCDELNDLALETLPAKQQLWKKRTLLLPLSNSLEPASDKERREAYKKLFQGNSLPYDQVTGSGRPSVVPKEPS